MARADKTHLVSECPLAGVHMMHGLERLGDRASSVHFLHLTFTGRRIDAFRDDGAEVLLGIAHSNYDHTVMLPQPLRETLSKVFE